jgi:hypothetical protein
MRRRAPARSGQTAIRTALKEMGRGGVNMERIPDEATVLLEEAHTPPEREHPAFKPRGREEGSCRRERHASLDSELSSADQT